MTAESSESEQHEDGPDPQDALTDEELAAWEPMPERSCFAHVRPDVGRGDRAGDADPADVGDRRWTDPWP